MKILTRYSLCISLLTVLVVSLTVLSTRMRADTGTCGGASITLPFTDVPAASVFFCTIAEAYFSGLTNGTTPTTYAPSANVSRDQMAAFVSRTLDQSLKRGSRRAAFDQWWTPTSAVDRGVMIMSSVGGGPLPAGAQLPKTDGQDLFVPFKTTNEVYEIGTAHGAIVHSFTGVTSANAVLIANGFVYAVGGTAPGRLYNMNPGGGFGSFYSAATLMSSALGNGPQGIAYDGQRIWTANSAGSVSIVTLTNIGDIVASVQTASAGFASPTGIIFDGSSIWITDTIGKLMRLNSNGTVAQSITVGLTPAYPIFDGTNIWVPNFDSNSVTVVRVRDTSGGPLATAIVLATLSGNGLNQPVSAAFDGERILVTNFGGNSVSLWKATDFTPIGTSPIGYHDGVSVKSKPYGACSDGLNFYVTLSETYAAIRF